MAKTALQGVAQNCLPASSSCAREADGGSPKNLYTTKKPAPPAVLYRGRGVTFVRASSVHWCDAVLPASPAGEVCIGSHLSASFLVVYKATSYWSSCTPQKACTTRGRCLVKDLRHLYNVCCCSVVLCYWPDAILPASPPEPCLCRFDWQPVHPAQANLRLHKNVVPALAMLQGVALALASKLC